MLRPLSIVLVTALLNSCNSQSLRPAASGPASVTEGLVSSERVLRFSFHYDFELRDLPAGAKWMRAWIPAPNQDQVQQSELVSLEAPVPSQQRFEATHGNRYLYFESSLPIDKPLRWRLIWQITRQQLSDAITTEPVADQYLGPNQNVPIDGKVSALTHRARLGQGAALQRARQLYDFVLQRMSYAKHGTGWGRGDAVWACDSRYGNCTDFHSVFIGMSRASQIPAKFEMGFPLPYAGTEGTIGGYHCWAKFHDGQRGWYGIDISEADKNPALSEYFFGRLHARRVHFTTGRDLVLVPKQDGPPLNYFIYPYVEIDRKVHAGIDQQFSFDSLSVLD